MLLWGFTGVSAEWWCVCGKTLQHPCTAHSADSWSAREGFVLSAQARSHTRSSKHAPVTSSVPPQHSSSPPSSSDNLHLNVCQCALSYLTVKQQLQLPVNPLLNVQPPLQVLAVIFHCQLAQLTVCWLFCFVPRLEHHPGLGAGLWRHGCHGLRSTVEAHRAVSPPGCTDSQTHRLTPLHGVFLKLLIWGAASYILLSFESLSLKCRLCFPAFSSSSLPPSEAHSPALLPSSFCNTHWLQYQENGN